MGSLRKCINNRHERAREKLKNAGLCALFVSNGDNVRYLTGYTGNDAWVLLTQNNTYLYTDFRNASRADREIVNTTLREINGNLLTAIVGDCSYVCKTNKSIGIESETITLTLYKQFRKAVNQNITNTNKLIENLRIIKDSDEVKRIKKAASIAVKTWNRLFDWLQTQKTFSEHKIYLMLETILREEGAQGTSFQTIVAAGERSAEPHPSFPRRNHFFQKPMLHDFGAVYEGYCSDLTRTIFFAKVDARNNRWYKKIYRIVSEAQKTAIAAIKPGAAAKDIDDAARHIIEKAGYGKLFGHSLGHGVGIAVHELPVISKKSEHILKPGMVFTVEPGIYISGKGGVRIEDMVLVTDGGCEILTDNAREQKDMI